MFHLWFCLILLDVKINLYQCQCQCHTTHLWSNNSSDRIRNKDCVASMDGTPQVPMLCLQHSKHCTLSSSNLTNTK